MNRGVYISIYVYIWIHVKTCIINASTLSLISLTYHISPVHLSTALLYEVLYSGEMSTPSSPV